MQCIAYWAGLWLASPIIFPSLGGDSQQWQTSPSLQSFLFGSKLNWVIYPDCKIDYVSPCFYSVLSWRKLIRFSCKHWSIWYFDLTHPPTKLIISDRYWNKQWILTIEWMFKIFKKKIAWKIVVLVSISSSAWSGPSRVSMLMWFKMVLGSRNLAWAHLAIFSASRLIVARARLALSAPTGYFAPLAILPQVAIFLLQIFSFSYLISMFIRQCSGLFNV